MSVLRSSLRSKGFSFDVIEVPRGEHNKNLKGKEKTAMITFGTIRQINRTQKGNYILLRTATDKDFICSTKNADGLEVGAYVAAGGCATKGELLKNALLMPYTPSKNYLSQPQYKPLWSI